MNIYINDRRRVADYYECESTPRIRSIKEITKKHVEFFVYYEEFFYSTTNKSVFDKASEYLKNNCPVQIIYDILICQIKLDNMSLSMQLKNTSNGVR